MASTNVLERLWRDDEFLLIYRDLSIKIQTCAILSNREPPPAPRLPPPPGSSAGGLKP